ncbi:sensor domain-containing diguanylate cyclase [Aurantiacibacter aquimixticola]|uniref:diguanylate cyclase n=1 Tax=Aurantiacibacter aquimixticola TaxID=1958945 RepID=A0A419RUD1_9SPHN|nr:diguanylate cyclase [Aurantiacibacter aquimixticola]RJY09403.1 sensor domain-containing diguanylate cyclase [Aurantiacibacter aquimixticola]
MEWGVRVWLKWVLLAALAAVWMPASAAAQTAPASPVERCHAASTVDTPLASSLTSLRWNCTGSAPSHTPERVILRFDASVYGGADERPLELTTRRAPLETLHILVEADDGSMRMASYAYDDMRPTLHDADVAASVPPLFDAAKFIYVAFDAPTNAMTLSEARLAEEGVAMSADEILTLLWLAALCGALAMPLIFNASAYRVLREPFVLWHAVLSLALLFTVILDSGFSAHLFGWPPSMLSALNSLCVGVSVTAAGMFCHSFVEPGRMSPALRRAIPFAGLWTLLVTAWHVSAPFALRPVHTELFHLAFVPVLSLYLAALVSALLRGSRAARFQLIGWLPLLMVGAVRIGSQTVPDIAPADVQTLFYIGCFVEVVATALGVADRFMILKRQRDRARAKANVLEEVSERDTLTGLYNRRIVEGRFDELRRQGFTTLAVIDLDHFKSINDTFGHAQGDEVLRSVAGALEGDDDTTAMRMGGEEFVLLLRGENAEQRAEDRRTAIPRAVARDTGLPTRVTASMGLVVAPIATMPNASFEQLYARADRLLYEAKHAGRDRTMSERLQAFSPLARKARSPQDRAAA